MSRLWSRLTFIFPMDSPPFLPPWGHSAPVCPSHPLLNGKNPRSLRCLWKEAPAWSLVISGILFWLKQLSLPAGGTGHTIHQSSIDTDLARTSFFWAVACRPCRSVFPQVFSLPVQYFTWFPCVLCEQLVLTILKQLVVGLLPSFHMVAPFSSSRHITLDILFMEPSTISLGCRLG